MIHPKGIENNTKESRNTLQDSVCEISVGEDKVIGKSAVVQEFFCIRLMVFSVHIAHSHRTMI